MRFVLRPAVVLLLLLTAITGFLYPLAITGIAQGLFPAAANGSLIERDGKVIGSALIAQPFSAPHYFHPRPSAAGKDGYDAANSGGSNLAPTAKALVERVAADIGKYRAENGPGDVPMDAVTTSGSGLDPDISPANAQRQAARVAAARGLALADVQQLIDRNTARPWFLFGMPAVNVLRLNLALDEMKPMPR